MLHSGLRFFDESSNETPTQHRAFPNITCNRLGPRGSTKHCYKGLQRRLRIGSAPGQTSQPATAMNLMQMADAASSVLMSSGVQQAGSYIPDHGRTVPLSASAYASQPYARGQGSPLQKRLKVEDEEEPATPANRDLSSQADEEESDYERLEMPEHTSEGISSDWDTDGDGFGGYPYLDLMKEGHAHQQQAMHLQRHLACGGQVSDGLLQFLRSSGSADHAQCPHINVPPYISPLGMPPSLGGHQAIIALSCDPHHLHQAAACHCSASCTTGMSSHIHPLRASSFPCLSSVMTSSSRTQQ